MNEYYYECAVGTMWLKCNILHFSDTHYHIIYEHPFQENTWVERVVTKELVR